MGKFARSWALAKASMSVLRSDKELLVFPLLSVLAVMLVAATFLLPLFGFGVLDGMHRGEGVPLGFSEVFPGEPQVNAHLLEERFGQLGVAARRLEPLDPDSLGRDPCLAFLNVPPG